MGFDPESPTPWKSQAAGIQQHTTIRFLSSDKNPLQLRLFLLDRGIAYMSSACLSLPQEQQMLSTAQLSVSVSLSQSLCLSVSASL